MLRDCHAIRILKDGSCYRIPVGWVCRAPDYPDDSHPEEQIVDIGITESNIHPYGANGVQSGRRMAGEQGSALSVAPHPGSGQTTPGTCTTTSIVQLG